MKNSGSAVFVFVHAKNLRKKVAHFFCGKFCKLLRHNANLTPFKLIFFMTSYNHDFNTNVFKFLQTDNTAKETFLTLQMKLEM